MNFSERIFPKTLHLNIGDPSVFKHLIDTRGALDFDPKTKVNIDARMIHDKAWKQPSEKRFVEFLIGKHSAIAFNRERIHVHVLAGNIRTIFLNLGLVSFSIFFFGSLSIFCFILSNRIFEW